mmetsp:Transcript_22137/g.52946  ORF Transcript_22137/g.52946 Transcript_22137/m.52946 type:complete len:112 (+) Transcript_22137:352-687(+)
MIPVFNFHEGYLSVNYSDNYFRLSQRHPEVPRLSPKHYEAMDLFNSLARSPEIHLKQTLEPGEMQLLNNHTCLRYRGAFVDGQLTRKSWRGSSLATGAGSTSHRSRAPAHA